MENSYESHIVTCCTDLDIKILSQDLYEIRTTKSKYTIRLKTEERHIFLHIVDTILPKLNGSAPLTTVLSQEDLSLFEPFIAQLHQMGVIFFFDPTVANYVRTPNDIRLYTYLARRTTNPDFLFLQIKQQKFALYAPKLLTDDWATILRTQGLEVVEPQLIMQNQVPPVIDRDVTLVILTVISEDAAFLQVANQHFYEQKIPWVPIIIEPTKIQLGPWINSRETPCYSCLVSNGQAHLENQEMVDDPFKQRKMMTGWASLQPSAIAWVGGLLAQMALRTLVPISDEPPWGRVTTLDIVALSQETRRVWKYPYCPVCSKHTLKVQQWVEV